MSTKRIILKDLVNHKAKTTDSSTVYDKREKIFDRIDLPAICILLASLFIRYQYFLELKTHPELTAPIIDARYYHEWAISIKDGNWLGGHDVFKLSPGYSYFLAIIYRMGGNLTTVYLVQLFLGSLMCVLIYLITKQIQGKTWAIAAGLIGCFYFPAIFYEQTLLKVTLINLLNLLMLYYLIKFIKKRNLRYLTYSGIFLSISIQFRPNILICIPFFLPLFFVIAKSISFGIKSTIFFIYGVAPILLIVALRNYMVGKEFVLTTAHGGMNFYTGNNPIIRGPYTPLSFARSDPQFEQDDFINEANRRSGQNLNSTQSSDFWYKASFDFIEKYPLLWIKLIFNKFLWLWNKYEQPININYHFYEDQISFLRIVPHFSYALIFVMGGYGILMFANNVMGYPLLLYFIAYILALTAFFSVSEYRFPLVPIMIIGTVNTCRAMYQAIRDVEWRIIIKILTVICILTFVTNIKTLDPKYDMAVSFNSIGSLYLTQGDLMKSEKNYLHALQLVPDFADPYYNLSRVYEMKDSPLDAISYYEKAYLIKPDLSYMYASDIARDYFNLNKFPEAIRTLKNAIKINPTSEYFHNLGMIYLRIGMQSEAVKCFTTAIALTPAFGISHQMLGLQYLKTNEFEKALYQFSEAIKYSPKSSDLYNSLGITFLKLKRFNDAYMAFRKALVLSPNNSDAKHNMMKMKTGG